MLDYDGGEFVESDLGFAPSPSGGEMLLLQEEEVHDAFLLLCGYTPSLDAPDHEEGTLLVTIVGLVQSVFGYPNEEAFWFDSRGEHLRLPEFRLAAGRQVRWCPPFLHRIERCVRAVPRSAGGGVHREPVQRCQGRSPTTAGPTVCGEDRSAAAGRTVGTVLSGRPPVANHCRDRHMQAHETPASTASGREPHLGVLLAVRYRR